jgi:hypothetical protein
MDTNNRSIPELVADRKALARQQSEINQMLEALDTELFSRLESALEAFGIKAPSKPTPDSRQANLPMPGFPAPLPNRPAPSLPPMPPKPPSPRQGEIGYLIEQATLRLLMETGEPLKTSEIHERLTKKGIEIPGKDPRNNLSAHLSRNDAFIRKGDGWWFAEKTRAAQ